MPRIYADENTVFTRRSDITVDMCLSNGETVEKLEPRRLFPIKYADKYISLIDEDGKERAIIRDIGRLDESSTKCIKACLEQYYIVPHITEIIEVYEKGSVNRWTVMTDRGKCVFHIKTRYSDIKPFDNGYVLIRDTNDNRYVIDDVKKLSRHSLREINSQI